MVAIPAPLSQISRRIGVIAVLIYAVGATSASGAQVSNVLVPAHASRVQAIPIERFKPALEAVDSSFECGTPEVHTADLLFPVNSTIYFAQAPSRAHQMMTVSVFVDSLGNILRFAERRGPPIGASPRGMSPSQVGAAVQAAALQSRSTTVTVDYVGHRGSVANRGGELPEEMAVSTPEVLAELPSLGRPGERAARVVAACRGTK